MICSIKRCLYILPILVLLCSCKNTDDINVILDWTPNTNHTGLYVAQEMGYFDEVGLKVTISQPPEDSSTLLVGSGVSQFGVSSQDSVAMALSAKYPIPITALAAIIQQNTSGIVSLAEKNITSPKDMENRTYSTWNAPIEKAMVKHIVEKSGGDFKKVKLVPNTSADIISSLMTRIDTAYIYYGWDGIAAKEKGIKTNFLYLRDYSEELDFYAPLIIANNRYIEQNPRTTQKFMRAVCKGYNYAISNPYQSAKILLKACPELDEEITVQSQIWLSERYKGEQDVWGLMDENRWNNFFGWLYDNGIIENRIPTNLGFTNKYLTKAGNNEN